MKICQIITTLELGGAETLLANYSNIHVAEHDITIIYLKGEPKISDLFSRKVKILHIPLKWNCASRIREFLKSYKPDIVHTHLGHADLIGLWASRNLPIKRFCTMHNISFKWDWRDKVFFFIYKLYFRTIAADCRLICISNVVAKHVKEVLKVKKENVTVIYNGIPESNLQLTKEESRLRLDLPNEKFIVLFVGRLEKQKAVHILLEAVSYLKDIPNLQIEIIGSGSLRVDLQNIANELDIGHLVNFRGNTFESETWFQASDIFVLPSIFEGLGIVILEAFRATVPVIASSVEGPAELIEDGKNGLLFQPGNSKELAEKIRLLFNNRNVGNSLSGQALSKFKGQFTITNYATILEALYKS